MAKEKKTVSVVSQEYLSQDVCSMWLQAGDMALEAGPGQFLSVYCRDGSRLLPRPVSICEIDKNLGRIRIVYRTVGSGTREMALWKEGDLVEILGPLGNGFPDVSEDRTAFLIEIGRASCRERV